MKRYLVILILFMIFLGKSVFAQTGGELTVDMASNIPLFPPAHVMACKLGDQVLITWHAASGLSDTKYFSVFVCNNTDFAGQPAHQLHSRDVTPSLKSRLLGTTSNSKFITPFSTDESTKYCVVKVGYLENQNAVFSNPISVAGDCQY